MVVFHSASFCPPQFPVRAEDATRAYRPAFHILMLSVPIGEQRSNVAGGSLRPAPTQPGPRFEHFPNCIANYPTLTALSRNEHRPVFTSEPNNPCIYAQCQLGVLLINGASKTRHGPSLWVMPG
jgi:hypothetical protein